MSFPEHQDYAGEQKREVIINAEHAKSNKMNPDQPYQSTPPSSSSFAFPYEHHHRHNNGDNHHNSRKIHHPFAKTTLANNKEVEKEEEFGHNMTGINTTIRPSSTTYVIAMPSCPSSSSTSTSAYSSPTSVNIPSGYRRHLSKDSYAIGLPPTSPTEPNEFYAKNIGTASALVVSYLIEVTVQVLLTIQCYRSFQQQQLDSVTDSSQVTSSSPWFWFLVISSVLSSFLVTLISVIWVFRGMDFSGRLCGRLLCYVMHSFLLGLLWRYLKLAFAYDRADLEEFLKLKTIQTFVQSLPLVTIHLACVLYTQEQLLPLVDSYHALSSWLVVAEMLSAVISLLVLSSSAVSSSSACNYNSNNHNLQAVVAAASAPSITASLGDNSKNNNQRSRDCSNRSKLNVENGRGDNNPNHHFNDSGTASSVVNHGAAEDENDIGEKCSSVASLKRLTTLAIKWTTSLYSQKCEPGRALLLVSRVISLGILVHKMNYYWTGFIALLHLGISTVWLGCWFDKPNGNNASSSSSAPGTACIGVNDSNDTCCDTKSNASSSNDSGLVVKSEVLIENAYPGVIVPGDHGDVNAGDDNGSEGYNNTNYNVSNCTRDGRASNDYQIKHKTKGDHVNPVNSLSGGLSSCLSVVVDRRNKAGNDNNKNPSANNRFIPRRENRRQVFMRVLPLSYVLFWDLSNSQCAYHLSSGNPITENILNPWSTALPILIAMVENMFITIYHHFWSDNEQNMRILTVSSATCLLLGNFLLVAYKLLWQSSQQRQEHRKSEQAKSDNDEDDVDSGYGKNKGNSCIAGGGSSSSDASVRTINRKETGECLSFCCSSLSHPLNIKRKGRREQQHQQEKHFCTDSRSLNAKLSSFEHQHQQNDVTFVKYNEYQEQQELGTLMTAPRRHPYNLSHAKIDDGSGQSSGSRNNSTTKSKRVTKKTTIFPDLGIASDHTGGKMGEAGYEDNNDNFKICSRPESMMRYREDVKMTMACGTTTTAPVTNNNHTNIKEAFTKKISNKSCTNDGLKKSHHHHPSNSRISQACVKGDEEAGAGEGETQVAISSFKSSSSPSTRVQQHQSTTTNSNKCMPISIKSSISWLPETCCNDSNGSGSSSNSRNTNTLVVPEPTAPNESRLFYCPEKYIDLGNNANAEETEESKRTSKKQQPKQQRQHHIRNPKNEGNCDFSVVFFEGRTGGGTSRSYKQKQCRTPVASNALLLRAARSANTTPVASSKPFPLDIGATTLASSVQQRNHPYFQPSYHHQQDESYIHDDDEVDPIERARKEEGATHRRIRNQITGKTYLSDGASLTSLDGLCEIRASTPVEIKKASRVIVNYPPPHHQISDSKTVSRCLCKSGRTPSPEGARNNRKQCGLLSPLVFHGCEAKDHHPERAGGNSNNNNIYEKLIDDSYGILICEGENAIGNDSLKNKLGCNKSKLKCKDGRCQKLKILCAKCLENHDPLLTNCVESQNIVEDDHLPEIVGHCATSTNISNGTLMHNWQEQQNTGTRCLPQVVSQSPNPYIPAESDTTDYPSDTEFTTNNNPVEDDIQSLSTHFSSATYTWQHQQQQHNYHHHYHSQNQQQSKPTQLSQFIWAASTMMPTLGGCEDGDGNSQHCSKEFTGLEYVRTWLMSSHPRTFSLNNISHHNTSSGGGYNNTHQHPLVHHQQQQQQENGIKRNGKNSNGSLRRYAAHQHHLQSRSDKGLTLLSSATSKNNHVPLKHKSTCDKTISKKKRFRQLEKRQRPVGRGASPPAKELGTSNNINGNADVLNSISATALPTSSCDNTTAATARDDFVGDSSMSARFQPPPSRKQHPLLFYDMIPRQEQQKPLTATSHKKCRDQLDLFHKELETVV